MIGELVRKARSYRRFREESISEETLRELVNFARLSSCMLNLQPLKYILSFKKETNELIFPLLAWAAYLKDWAGPEEGQRPSAYIIILGDTSISKSFGCDHGIASQSIVLGAAEKGLTCCMIGAVNRERLREIFKVPEQFDILHLIALGRPGEEIRIEKVGPDGDIKYWRDDSGVHHVPKRSLDEIIIPIKK